MAKITIDNWTQGLAPKNWINPATFGNKFGKPGQYLSGEINPFYAPGFLLGGNTTYSSPTNESALTDTGRIEKFIVSDDNVVSSLSSIYFIQNTSAAIPQFHQANTAFTSISSSGSTPKWPKITNTTAGQHNAHTDIVFDDIFRYQLNGVHKTFVLMRDGTDWDLLKWDSTLTAGDVLGNVGSAATGYTTTMVDFLKPSFALVASNGYCYIVNSDKIVKFDGTLDGNAAGILTNNVLTIPNSEQMVDGIDFKGKMWLLKQPRIPTLAVVPASWSSEKYASWIERDISVIVWDRDSTVISIDDTIKIDGATEVFAIRVVDGVPHVWGRGGGGSTGSSRGIVKLWAYDGSKFVVVKEIGDGQDGQPSTRSSIVNYMGGVAWQDINAALWWYGGGNLFKIGKSTATIDTSGSGGILTMGTGLVVPRIESSVMKAGVFNPMATTSAGNSSYIVMAPVYLPKLSTINGITIFFYAEANASTGTVAVDIYNKNSATPVTKYIDLDVDVPRGYAYFPLALENSNLVGLRFGSQLSFTIATMPKIERIEIDYTPTSKLK